MKKEIKVSGHLEVIKGFYHMKLSWVSAEGKRQRKSKSTELPVRGNKKKAQDMLIDFQREQEAKLVAMGNSAKDILFTDYMKQWLEKTKLHIQPTTIDSYEDNVNGIIIPYFKPMKLKLREVTPKHIQDFYTE